MQVNTERFGIIEIDEKEVIKFENGLPGFENNKRYILLPADEKQETPFLFLQSIDTPELCFFLLDTFTVIQDYEVNIDDSVIEMLKIEKEQEVLIVNIVTTKGSLKEATVNLKAPIVINIFKGLGKQILLDNNNYLIKHPLFAQQQEKETVEKGR